MRSQGPLSSAQREALDKQKHGVELAFSLAENEFQRSFYVLAALNLLGQLTENR